jgi:lysophospholipase L1-like esterase
MGDHIKEEGWHNWDKPHAEKTAFYAEYNSFGPGGSAGKRAGWAHLLNEEEAKSYTIENIFGSIEGWPTLGSRETPETRIFLAGDSTVEDVRPEQGNKKGWGQMLPAFFTQKAKVVNKAKGGRSTKSFINEGHLQELLGEIRPGDFLLIQFGHNDQKVEDPSRGTEPYSTYQEYLSQYIAGAREKRAIPVLLTPVNRRTFDEKGKLSASLGEYPEAMRHLALKQDVLLIDLWEKSKALYEELGPEKTKTFFAWYETAMDTPPDDTHFSAAGAAKIAELVVEGIQELGLGAAHFLIEKHVEKSLAR